MAASLLRRTSIIHNVRRFNFPSSWCLSELLTQYFPIVDNAGNENTIHRVSKGVSFYSQVASGGGLPSSMRGAVFWEKGKPLSMEEFRIPHPKAGEVLLRTQACGVCHCDLHVMKDETTFRSPCVLGHEITGEVVEHGPLTDNKTKLRLPIGSRVVGSFIMPCGSCSHCSEGYDQLCEKFSDYNRTKGTLYDGETRLFLRSSGKPVYMYSMGGLAEYCVVLANALAVLPDSLPYSESAILGCAVFTAYGAMAYAAKLRRGDSIAVIGTGGLGSSCLQIARAFGASEIIAVDIQDGKLEKAKTFGATHTVNAAREDPVEKIIEITGGGVDVVVKAVGTPHTFSQCIHSVKAGGKAVLIGPIVGQMSLMSFNQHKVSSIIGSYGARVRQDLPELVRLAETGVFNLSNTVSRRYNFEEANRAFADLNQGKIVGRAVIEIR